MQLRHTWINRIESVWQKRTVIWLCGVRRTGKTYLGQSLDNIEYFDCELPRVRQMLDDPEGFLSSLGKARIVLDEIHRLSNPSQMLKIAADHFPQVKVLATGSSTLDATTKFRDSLTGRKQVTWLTPMNQADLKDFGNENITHRLSRGGLPPFFMAKKLPEADFQDWMDAYWAKDIQELFRLERRQSFQRFVELLLTQSGSIFEATKFAAPCEVSRPTMANYLNVLEVTLVAHIIRPYTTRKTAEIVSAPKVYGFDTGFISYYKGWNELRNEDLGYLWEHFILNELNGCLRSTEIRYWRDKQGHEVDFVVGVRGDKPTAIECKWKAREFKPNGIKAFRNNYPNGTNLVVASDIARPYVKTFGALSVKFIGSANLSKELFNEG